MLDKDLDLIENEENEEEELFEHYRFKVDLGQEVLRIDKFLLDRLPNTSRNKIQIAAKNGNIVVNGATVKPNYRVKPKDDVAIVLPYPVREIELIAQDIPIEIVYEDDSFVIVNKSSGEYICFIFIFSANFLSLSDQSPCLPNASPT